MLAFRLETWEEAKVIFVFHVVGTAMEIFKTSVGSWIYPEPSLLPADPGDRALARVVMFRHDDFTKPYYALRREEEGAADAFDRELAKLDAQLTRQPWLTGAAFGLADIAYVPWVLRARDMLGVELDRFPELTDWLERMVGRPSVAAEAQVIAAL